MFVSSKKLLINYLPITNDKIIVYLLIKIIKKINNSIF
ncbi:MAG: hypothetical protein NT02SARS_1764 [SAR86 cluster bacterium SAR86B]|uniref:Uncharacterized protein n=1 Tax=SAR86 cluster bacterium SAR86B TaxID=1123867 RepID=J4KSR2_9GAMM|nr:MAG: hypothetical protein NT02SARS_1764 [SAR86 cluster bacterium SAR86B]